MSGLMPQWSPVMKTGNTCRRGQGACAECDASMEPGHEDREYVRGSRRAASLESPQWSPVMKTGNTGGTLTAVAGYAVPQWSPVMKTGNTSTLRGLTQTQIDRLNGARSCRPGILIRLYEQDPLRRGLNGARS